MLEIQPLLIIGVMSGTSHDGIDIAACKFWIENNLWKFEIIHAETYAYTPLEVEQLKNTFHCSGIELVEHHHQYGNKIGALVKEFCVNKQIMPDYVASHGHTIFHQPNRGFTFQLGHGANIAAQSGIKTICDFRTTDVAFGGQGAPLVPIGDELLFPEYNYCLNLGGISNISFNKSGTRLAHDIGICNIMLNEIAQELNLSYDKDGIVASGGSIEESLLNELKTAEFKNKIARQSLGYEWYSQNMKPILKKFPASVPNKLFTSCIFIAQQIAAEIKNDKTVLLSGGGVKNKFLVKCIQEHTKAKIIIPNHQIIDFKEALIFSFLGLLRVYEKENALANVTMASKNSIGGAIYLP